VAGAILAMLLGIVGWLAGTTSGLRFVAALAMPHLPVAFDAAAIDGRLVGPLSIGPMELETPGVRGTIARVEMDWRPSALLNRQLHLRRLHIEAPLLDFRATAEPDTEPDPTDDTSLAWGVVLDRLSLRDGSVSYEGATIVDELQLELAGAAAGQWLELTRIEVRSGQGDITGYARASWAIDEPWDIDLDWNLLLDEHVASGRTRVTGSLAELAVEQDFSAPAQSRVEGVISGLPATPAWNLEVVIGPLPAQPGPWPEALDGMTARLHVAGRIEDSRITGQVELPAVLPGQTDLDILAGWQEGVANFPRFEIRLADGGRLDGSGHAIPGAEFTAEFAIEGTDLGWPLDEAGREIELPRLAVRGTAAADRWRFTVDGRVRREELPEIDVISDLEWSGSILTVERLELATPTGEIHATGHGVLNTADSRLDYRLTAAIELRLPEQPPVSARLDAAGDAHGVQIQTLSAQLLGGTVDGSGRITWHEGEEADFQLTFADLDPSGIAPDWPGRLGGRLQLHGTPDGEGLEVELSSVAGELREYPLSGEAALNFSGEGLLLRRAVLALGTASFEANGRIDEETVMLDARIEAPTLEKLHDAARGSLVASTRIDGARDAPRIALEATGERLGWGDNRARFLQVDAIVDLSGAQASRVRADLDGFALGPGPGAQLRLAGDGTPEEHRVRFEVERSRPEQRIVLALAGGLADSHWIGRLTALALEEEREQVWALRQPAALSAGADSVLLEDACMEGAPGQFCLQAAWNRGGPWHGRATLAELDLGPLSGFLGPGLLARGIVTGEIVVEADDDAFRALSGGVDLTEGDIRIAGEDASPLIAWDGGRLRLDGDKAAARAQLTLDLAGGDIVEGSLVVRWNEPDPPLDGQLAVTLEQLYLITELVPDLADLEGRATARATISGTLSQPQTLGRFEWLDGMAQIPTLGLRPSDISVVAELEDGELSFQARGRSGEGAFEANGRFDLGADTVAGQASLRGEDLLLADLPEARIAASPELRLSYSERRIVISGEVDIPSALISGLAAPTAITASVDEEIVGPRARVQEEDLIVTSRVRVTVGPDVQVQAAGFRGRVEGSILTVTQPEALPWGRGELRVVDGTFSIFGQRLEIETGRLIYTGGPLENPGLEIRAVRRVDEVTAGALVRGTLQQPEVSVYSDPPMARAEALSYLTIGKGLDELEAGEQSAVNQAANSLALAGGGLIARDLGRRLGFDDVAVAADEEGTSLVVGRYLGSGLYVSYGLGLFDTVNTLRLRYQISQRLSVEAISGAEAAADFFYTFERD
jgi:translocation and assembly module TamB